MAEETQQEEAAIIFSDLKNPTKIAFLECHVMMEKSFSISSSVPDHPVETGFMVHDHVINNPAQLSMTVFVSNTPVTWFDYLGGPSADYVLDAMFAFDYIWSSKNPITIVTDNMIYDDYVMTSCTMPQDEKVGRGAMAFQCEFKHIRKVDVKKEKIPAKYVSAIAKAKAAEKEKQAGKEKKTNISQKKNSNQAGSGRSGNNGGASSGNNKKTREKNESILHNWLGR